MINPLVGPLVGHLSKNGRYGSPEWQIKTIIPGTYTAVVSYETRHNWVVESEVILGNEFDTPEKARAQVDEILAVLDAGENPKSLFSWTRNRQKYSPGTTFHRFPPWKEPRAGAKDKTPAHFDSVVYLLKDNGDNSMFKLGRSTSLGGILRERCYRTHSGHGVEYFAKAWFDNPEGAKALENVLGKRLGQAGIRQDPRGGCEWWEDCRKSRRILRAVPWDWSNLDRMPAPGPGSFVRKCLSQLSPRKGCIARTDRTYLRHRENHPH